MAALLQWIGGIGIIAMAVISNVSEEAGLKLKGLGYAGLTTAFGL